MHHSYYNRFVVRMREQFAIEKANIFGFPPFLASISRLLKYSWSSFPQSCLSIIADESLCSSSLCSRECVPERGPDTYEHHHETLPS